MTEVAGRLAIGEVAARAGMSPSRIRYYEARGLLAEPERVAGNRRYTADVLRRLGIIDAAQRVGFTLDEISDLLGSRDQPAHERLRQLAVLKLPELDDLIARASSVRSLLRMCSRAKRAKEGRPGGRTTPPIQSVLGGAALGVSVEPRRRTASRASFTAGRPSPWGRFRA